MWPLKSDRSWRCHAPLSARRSTAQFTETRNVLMYVQRATRVIVDDTRDQSGGLTKEGEEEAGKEDAKVSGGPSGDAVRTTA